MVLPYLRSNKHGLIINISPIAVLRASSIADAAIFVAELPARACIPLLVIKPVIQKLF